MVPETAITRRGLAALLAAPGILCGASHGLRLSIGTYSMQSLPVDEALAHIRRIGYEGAELCVMPGWPSEPKVLDSPARQRIRDARFPIPTLIDNLTLFASPEDHRRALDRIKASAEFAHDISPDRPPLLQTVLGGRPSDWPDARDRMAARLEEWARAAADGRITLAVKAHVSNAADTPEKLLWLLNKVNHPALTAIYDYSHFSLLGLGMEQTMEQLLPRAAFLTVKDARRVNGMPSFLLPGEGTIDYVRYFAKVRELRWRGWVLVEVSRQLQTLSGYDPVAAAEKSYRHLTLCLNRP
jgi:inosose dehydratase